ncbi:MAG: sigma 54-interacting transcriptional regulator [Smithellaceae bacterium]
MINLNFSTEDEAIFYQFLSFPDFFSIDWFPEFPVSHILSVISALEDKQWIAPQKNVRGYYSWSPEFPRQEIIARVPPEEMSRLYRKAVDILRQKLQENDENALRICRQCLLAGIQEEDLDIILKTAGREEKCHRISSAISLYDAILEFMEDILLRQETTPSENVWRILITGVERRASLSLFHPNLKKTTGYLFTALDAARRLNDVRAEAYLELLIGQHFWMSFQYSEAVTHFDQGWELITKLEDEDLYKQGLKVKGLTFMISGRFSEAIESYERSLGEIESDENDNFSFLVTLYLALCYVQVGTPQRALGISERIQNYSKKNENRPLLAFALFAAGIILLEMRQFEHSRTYFHDAFEMGTRENLPVVEVLASIGLASLECWNGNYELAAEHFKTLWRIRKSSWFYFLNFYPFIETAYILHSKSVVQPASFDLASVTGAVEFLNQMQKGEGSALMYGMIKRLQIGLSENKTPIAEKGKILTELEKAGIQMGAAFEVARIRIELARLLKHMDEWQKAGIYARQAYDFFQPFAPNCFPSDLHDLIPKNVWTKNDRLFDLVIEMGEALMGQENLEQLLSSIITAITRLTGAERAALFIRDTGSAELKMVASRNLLKEEIQEKSFEKSLQIIHFIMTSNDGKIIQHDINGQEPTDFRRIIITPLRSATGVIGVLYQDSRFFSLDTSSDDNMKLLAALACQISVSIDRAQGSDEISRLNKLLIQEKLYYLEEKEEFRPFGEIIGQSNAVQVLYGLIRKVAPTNSTVLIAGETGVGKELIARAIHRESPRKDGPFIRVNCAALPDSLIDSELFGHEKGAFTGAIKTKAGRFELANQGTIFLDEISELPLPTQSRLLRILQEKEFQRVGGTKTLHSDFRLLTATNKDLHQEVTAKKFREDLFYRLNVFPIHVPPLRERKEDIPLLAVHFLKLFCSQSNKQYMGITESEIKKLQNYFWPGNIRELSNMIERAVISGNQISFPTLEGAPESDVTKIDISTLGKNHKLRNIVKDVERENILEVLEKTKGKVSGKDGAATILGMSRSALIRRMKDMKIKIERKPTK